MRCLDGGRHACLADLEPHIRVEVRAGGEVVAGQVSLVEDLSGLIVWRPERPLKPDAEHAVVVEIDNDAIAADPESMCGPGLLPSPVIGVDRPQRTSLRGYVSLACAGEIAA